MKLGQLGTVSGGSTPSTKVSEYWDGDIAWATPSDVTKCTDIYISDTGRKITKAGLENSATKLFPSGAVLMTSRATIGEVVINRIPMATNQGFINVVCDPRVAHNEYLAFWIRQNKRVFEERAHGVTFREISKSNFKEIPITLPPLPEQRAIAHTLRTVQTAREARRREAALERERKAALMQRLFTQGTRGEPTKTTEIGEVPVSWEVVKIEDKCMKIVDCPHTTPNFLNSGVLVIRNMNVRAGRLIIDPAFYTSEEEYCERIKRLEPKEGDVLFSREAPVGEACVIPAKTRLSLGQRMMLLRTDPKHLDAHFLVYSFYADIVRSRMMALTRGVTAPHLNVADVRGLYIPLPPLTEQRTIAAILRACDEKIAALEREAAVHDELFKALLEELMTGRLRATELIEQSSTV